MDYYFAGLGNPGAEYDNTRHNTGRLLLTWAAKKLQLGDFSFNKKLNAEILTGTIGKAKATLVLPNTFMNKSGLSVKPLVTSKPKAARLVVIYDDIDLPFGSLKISFNRGSGGHKGIESIARSVGTKEFIRIRVGVSPANAKGIAKKPHGEEAVLKFILGKFKPAELETLKKQAKTIAEIIETIATSGLVPAMNQFN